MLSRALEHEDNARWLTRRATDEFGAFLSGPQWDWYSTHTFKAEYVSPKEADRHYFAWLNSLCLAARVRNYERPFWFRGTEYQELRGTNTLHFHSLIGGVGDIRRLLFKDFWELHGFARVEAYQPGKGANYYVGKYLTKSAADIRFSHNLKQELERSGQVASQSGVDAAAKGNRLTCPDNLNRAERTPGEVAVSGLYRESQGELRTLPGIPQTNSSPGVLG